VNTERPTYLASGEPARLIPTFSEKSKEQRTTSIFLAAMMAVPPFGKKVLETIDVRCGKNTRIEAYTEVAFNRPTAKTAFRPDGLIIVRSGSSEWRALIEAKSGNAKLSSEQLQAYLEIAKEFNINALITISNQLAVIPSHHPMLEQIRRPRNVSLFHWSWTYILTEATLLVAAAEFDDPEQRYILSEVARYLKHPNSGVARFDRMASEWKELVTAIQNRVPLSADSSVVQKSVASWHQEQRDVCLLMSRRIGQPVELKLTRKQVNDVDERVQSDCKQLALQHTVEFSMDVPNTASPIIVTADVARRNLTCSMALNAPKDKKSTKARTNWLLRQLKTTDAGNVFVRAHWGGRTTPSQLPLHQLLENPDGFSNAADSKAVKSFEVLMTKDLGADFGRTTKFISLLEMFVPEFYHQVGQNLRSWKPAPPKISESKTVSTNTSQDKDEHPGTARGFSADRQVAPNLSVLATMSDDDESVELPSFIRRDKNSDERHLNA